MPPSGLSKEELFYWKVKNDKKWYIESFLKIRDKNAELIPFKFNVAQRLIYEKYLDCLNNGKLPRFIVLKSRQQGISTWTEAMMFSDTATNSFKNTFIIAHEGQASTNLFNMSKLYYSELPDLIKPSVSRSNEKALIFEDKENESGGLRSKFTIGTANTAEGGRGNTFNNVHVSEVAFFPNAEKTLTAIIQAVPDVQNTLVILESTANGVGDYFHRQWLMAKEGKSEFIPIFLPWSFDPACTKSFPSDEDREEFIKSVEMTYTDLKGDKTHTEEWVLKQEYELTYEQLYWRRWAINNKCGGSIEMFQQEYPINDIEAFLSTGRPVFNQKVLKEYLNSCKAGRIGYVFPSGNRCEFRDENKGFVELWKEPEQGKFYCIGADVAEGLEKGDYSDAYVLDAETFDIVASWHGHIDPDLYGLELIKLGKYYNDAYIGVENNNHGLTTLKAIQRAEYWNIFYTKTLDKITDKLTTKMGWTTSMRTKPVMIDKLNEFLREKMIGIKDKNLIGQMITYVREENGSTNAQVGCYDDRVMACAVALQVALDGRGDNFEIEKGDYRNKIKNKLVYSEDEGKIEVCN